MLEALAERFHVSPKLLKRLNPGKSFAAGEQIVVPNVEDPSLARLPTGRAGEQAWLPSPSRSRSRTSVARRDRRSGQVVFYAPVTTGSEHDPLPIGEWKVNGVQRNPTFHYNPALFWDAEAKDAKATIPARPQQSGRRGLDRHLSTALRTSRHAGAVDGREDRSRMAACASPTGMR